MFVITQGFLTNLAVTQGYASAAPVIPIPSQSWIEEYRGITAVEPLRGVSWIEPYRGTQWVEDVPSAPTRR